MKDRGTKWEERQFSSGFEISTASDFLRHEHNKLHCPNILTSIQNSTKGFSN